MANHRAAAAALLLIASLFVVVAISGADARPTVHPNKMAALRRDTHGRDYMADATALPEREPEREPELETPCDKCENQEPPCDKCEKEEPPCDKCEKQELPCEKCEKQEPPCDKCEKQEPPCHNCEEPKPESKTELTCHKVHGVKEGETCCSVWEGTGLTEDRFLDFNPNLCCEKLFVGQWVCLEATSGCHD